MSPAKGFFRIWVVFSVLVALGCFVAAGVGANNIRTASAQCSERSPWIYYSTPIQEIKRNYWIDVDKAKAEGATDAQITDYAKQNPGLEKPEAKARRVATCVETQKRDAWELIGGAAGVLVGVPLFILLAGWTIGWVWRGFFPKGAKP